MTTIFSQLNAILHAARQILLDEGEEAAADQKILAALAMIVQILLEIENKEQAILDLLGGGDGGPTPAPTSAKLDLPPVTRKGILLANYQLKNDWVVGPVAIVAVDDEGTAVPLPDGAVFTVSVDDAAVGNAVMADDTHVTFNALLSRGTFMMTFHEAASLLPDFSQGVDIVEDFTPVGGGLDLGDAPHTTQPVPPAPAP